MSNLTLYQIEVELADLISLRDDTSEPEEIAAIDAQIAEYVARELMKVDGIAALLREFDQRAAVATVEALRLKERAALWQARHDRLEDIAIRAMQAAGKTKLEGRTSTLALRKNPPSVDVRQPDLVPIDYRQVRIVLGHRELLKIAEILRQHDHSGPALVLLRAADVSEPRKAAIGVALKSGEAVPGCALITDNVRLEVK